MIRQDFNQDGSTGKYDRFFEPTRNLRYHNKLVKSLFIKIGSRNILYLIKSKEIKLVLIATDVVTITVVFIPTLCKRMNVSNAMLVAHRGEQITKKQVRAFDTADNSLIWLAYSEYAANKQKFKKGL